MGMGLELVRQLDVCLISIVGAYDFYCMVYTLYTLYDILYCIKVQYSSTCTVLDL